jgi:soluble lytic murein transglycosylase
VKAVVWRESKFRRLCLGSKGEIGLMQVTEGAAKEWAAALKRAAPSQTDLLDATTNLEAGTWYLKRALDRYTSCDDPIPFALAEYNAGPSNTAKWRAKNKDPNSSNDFISHIGIASTRRYVQDVTAIQKRLERRGHL